MLKKTRLILFFLFAFFYLVVAPLLIFYSFGYRIDWENRRIVGTGGLYLKVWPQETTVLIDDKIERKTGLFLNEILIQGLYPKKHKILVKKDGYNSWEKTLETSEREVTKIENVTLIKEKIVFEKLKENIENFYLSPNRDLILLFDSSENSFLIMNSQTKEIKNSFSLPNNDMNPSPPQAAGSPVAKGTSSFGSEIKIISWNEVSKIILSELENKYFSIDYNKAGQVKPELTSQVETETSVENENVIFSPDKSKFLFFNDHEIFYSNSDKPSEKIFLHRFSEKVQNCFWLNNYYLIFNVGGQIKISEIDTRDRINIVDIPQTISLSNDSVFELKNPKISWDEINKKLYILDQKTLFVSEPLTDKNNK